MTDATPTRASDDASVRSVRRALAILRVFRPHERSLPLGEISRRSELDKATARRLLRTLIGERVILQYAHSKEYALDLGVLALGVGITPADELRRRAQPKLAAIVAATGSAAFLLIPHEEATLCIEALDAEPPALAPWRVGERPAYHLDPAARVLMAHLRLEERMALLAGPLPAGPAAPPGDAAPDPFQLSARLDTIRQRDWDLSVGEATPGIAVLAIPVRRGVGGVVAALALAGPREAMLEGERPRHLDALRVRAGELERVLATTGRRGPG